MTPRRTEAERLSEPEPSRPDRAVLTGRPASARVRERMLADVVAGLSGAPKTLPSKYFYDEAGSRLFDEITQLDEYYLTRTETAIMETHVTEIVRAIGPRALVFEPGSGSSVKTRILLDHLEEPVGYVPIDISGDYLEIAAEKLRSEHPDVPILPLVADFTTPFPLPEPPSPPARTVAYFPGSTIGNYPVLEAGRLLRRIRSLAGSDGAVLIGFDLVKPADRLFAAYNDRDGVTARFNLNLLARLNRELGADFDLRTFRHHAPFNEDASRIEMHLISEVDQIVRIGGHAFAFDAGESVRTELSHKYTVESFTELARSAGLDPTHTWMDADRLFSVQLLEAI